jgi:hypothetical protein
MRAFTYRAGATTSAALTVGPCKTASGESECLRALSYIAACSATQRKLHLTPTPPPPTHTHTLTTRFNVCTESTCTTCPNTVSIALGTYASSSNGYVFTPLASTCSGVVWTSAWLGKGTISSPPTPPAADVSAAAGLATGALVGIIVGAIFLVIVLPILVRLRQGRSLLTVEARNSPPPPSLLPLPPSPPSHTRLSNHMQIIVCCCGGFAAACAACSSSGNKRLVTAPTTTTVVVGSPLEMQAGWTQSTFGMAHQQPSYAPGPPPTTNISRV